MRIDKIKIQNFRSVKKTEIVMNDCIAIIGKNNVGKSSILKALNAFFNYELEEQDFIDGHHSYTSRSTPQIEITFRVDNDLPSFQSVVKANTLSVRMRYLKSKKTNEYSYKIGRRYEVLSPRRKKEMLSAFKFILIPAFRDHQEIHNLETSILKKIILSILKSRKRDSFKSSTSAIEEKFKNTFRQVESAVKRNFLLEDSLGFTLDFEDDVDIKSFLAEKLKVNIIENEKPLLPKDCGTGIQSLLLITLYKYYADLTETSYLLSIEEPETNLHPQGQLSLMSSLKSLIKGDCVQMILTSHSPHIIDYLEHTDIILCQKRKHDDRIQTECHQLSNDYWISNDLAKFKSDNFFKYKNSDFFFSDRVLICEGFTDAELIRFLAKDNKVELLKEGFTLLTLEGVNNLNYPFSLVKGLNIPYFIFLDKDFFLPYENGRLIESRDSKFFPKYFNEFHNTKVKLIEKLIPNSSDRKLVERLLVDNHTKASEILLKYNIICFKWNLEVDLISSEDARGHYLNSFKLGKKQNIDEFKELLGNRHEAIKEHDRVVKILSKVDSVNFPTSFKKIKKALKDMKKKSL